MGKQGGNAVVRIPQSDNDVLTDRYIGADELLGKYIEDHCIF